MNAQEAVNSLKLKKSVATAIVIEDPKERYFIGEAFLAGASLWVLNRYFSAYLGNLLGINEAGQSHARMTKELLAKLRGKTYTKEDGVAITRRLQERIDLLEKSVEALRDSERRTLAERAAMEATAADLVSFGTFPEEAEEVASQSARAIESLVRKT